MNQQREFATRSIGVCVMAVVFAIAGTSTAPPAVADPADGLRAAVAAARGAACEPLRPDPVIDQAAAMINETTSNWIDNTSRAVPATDASPLLRELGHDSSNTAILSGAAKDAGVSIKGLVLQGWAEFPDCSYADFGVSTLYNPKKDLVLTTVVLAG